MSGNRADEVDKHIGGRIRLRRIMLEMSQAQLGLVLGITFQQIQKYEKGTSRVGASSLLKLAKALKCPPTFFFEGAPGADDLYEHVNGSDRMTEFMTDKDIIKLNKAFHQIKDGKVRANLIHVTNAIAGLEDAE